MATTPTTTSTSTSTTKPPTTTTATTTPTTSSTTTSSTSTSSTAAPPTTTTLPRFGNPTVGRDTSVNSADYERMSSFALGETGTVTRLVIYLASAAGGSQRLRPGVHRDPARRPGAPGAPGAG